MQLGASVKTGTLTGLKVLWNLAKVIIPAMIVVNVLDKAGILPYISQALGPAMSLFGVPGEGALVLVTANFVSYYAGLATLIALALPWKQLMILAAMMMVCHGAIYETAMVAKAGARAGWVLGARVLAMIAVGLIFKWVLP